MENAFLPRLPGAVLAEARTALRDTGAARIPDFLPDESARELHVFFEQAEWQPAVTFGKEVLYLEPRNPSPREEAQRALLVAAAHRRAVGGFSYTYDNIHVSNEPDERRGRGWPVDRLLEAWNGSEGLAFFRDLLDEPGVVQIDGRATRYRAGDFLTRHDDSRSERHTAYVLGLSPEWRPDWGGLLLLHDMPAATSEALHPQFNTLTLFRVPCDHSVSVVAPFAPAPRYAFTGWCNLAPATG